MDHAALAAQDGRELAHGRTRRRGVARGDHDGAAQFQQAAAAREDSRRAHPALKVAPRLRGVLAEDGERREHGAEQARDADTGARSRRPARRTERCERFDRPCARRQARARLPQAHGQEGIPRQFAERARSFGVRRGEPVAGIGAGGGKGVDVERQRALGRDERDVGRTRPREGPQQIRQRCGRRGAGGADCARAREQVRQRVSGGERHESRVGL